MGAGVGTVRYEGGTAFSSASLSPALRFDSPSVAASLDGTLALLPDMEWSRQVRADIWLASATPSAWRIGLQLKGTASARTGSLWSAAAHGVAELIWSRANWGAALGAGPSTGWIAETSPLTAFHARARLWGGHRAGTWSFSVEPTRFVGAWFTDVTAGLGASVGPVNASLWGAARLSDAYGSAGGGGVFAQVFLSPRIALEVGGGAHLREPYEGLPRAGWGLLGLRLHSAPRVRPRPPAAASPPPLTLERRGDSVTVRFRMDGATTVAIAGTWGAWQPQALKSHGNGIWAGTLVIPPGSHEFNLVVDGTQWVVPAGVAIIKDEMGGLTGLLVVK